MFWVDLYPRLFSTSQQRRSDVFLLTPAQSPRLSNPTQQKYKVTKFCS